MQARFLFILLCNILCLSGFSLPAHGIERQPDPDGCFSCHALEGLDYFDTTGVLRTASINKQHYYSSLHGSVPCNDCHRKIEHYPHKVENGEVDCGESCHVEEPSQGEPYSHQYVVKEYKDSVHGKGWSKGLTGGNRLEETNHQQDPSCRQCHSNDLYIDPSQLPKFMKDFDHVDGECGSCHQGEVWLGQFGGHILRRFTGSRWNKHEHNKMCNTCHADHARMTEVVRDTPNKDKEIKEKADARFILSRDSYATTLHARLLETNVMEGASCLDCHATDGFRHGILPDENTESSTHTDQLADTCAQSACHAYATHPLNKPFVKTDLHDLDMVSVNNDLVPRDWSRLESGWVKAFIALLPIIIILGGASLWSRYFGEKKKGLVFSEIGGDAFQENIIGRKPKKKKAKKKTSKVKPAPTPTPTPTPTPKSKPDIPPEPTEQTEPTPTQSVSAIHKGDEDEK